MKSQNFFLPFLLLSTTLIISSLIIFPKFKPTPSLNQNTPAPFKTYTNSDLQFQYPPDWNMESVNIPQSENDFSFYLKPANPSQNKSVVLTVQVLKNATAKYTFNTCCRQTKAELIGANSFYTKGLQNLEGMIDWTYITGNEDKLVRFNLGIGNRDDPSPFPNASEFSREFNEFMQILSTVKQSNISYSPSSQPMNWKTYVSTDSKYSFQYPSNFNPQPIQLVGSGYMLDFVDTKSDYILTLTERSNYNNNTGDSFKSLQEYVNQPESVKPIIIGGQKGLLYPSESTVVFFTKDSKKIITLELTSNNKTDMQIEADQKLFSQILSTISFIEQK